MHPLCHGNSSHFGGDRPQATTGSLRDTRLLGDWYARDITRHNQKGRKWCFRRRKKHLIALLPTPPPNNMDPQQLNNQREISNSAVTVPTVPIKNRAQKSAVIQLTTSTWLPVIPLGFQLVLKGKFVCKCSHICSAICYGRNELYSVASMVTSLKKKSGQHTMFQSMTWSLKQSTG